MDFRPEGTGRQQEQHTVLRVEVMGTSAASSRIATRDSARAVQNVLRNSITCVGGGDTGQSVIVSHKRGLKTVTRAANGCFDRIVFRKRAHRRWTGSHPPLKLRLSCACCRINASTKKWTRKGFRNTLWKKSSGSTSARGGLLFTFEWEVFACWVGGASQVLTAARSVGRKPKKINESTVRMDVAKTDSLYIKFVREPSCFLRPYIKKNNKLHNAKY